MAETAMPCTLQLLQEPTIVVPGRRLRLSPKDAALLALIACEGPVRGERVAGLLWPAAGSRQADTSLRQRLYRLRREAGHPLVDSGSTLALHPEVATDLAQALQRLTDDEQAAAGELLGDLSFDDLPDFADWLRAQRQHWRERRAAALAALADRCEKDGALVRGLVYAQRHVDDEPLAEHAQRRLMRLHYLRGDRAAAIAAFERFELRLKDELGARPSAETLELLDTIEHGAVARAGPRSVLPAALMRPPRLVGREGDLERLEQAWAAQHVVVVIGEAGIGKSRLLGDFEAGQAGVVGVQARPGDESIAHALLARLLRAVLARHAVAIDPSRRSELALVLPELGEPKAVAGDAQRLLLQRSVEALLGDALAQGLRALLIDDLHFADEASLGAVQSLLQVEALAGLRWSLAHRPVDADSTLAALRGALEEGGRIETLVLAPLNESQLADLVLSLGLPELDAAGLAPALLRHTGGNPLFALETLKALVLRETTFDPAGRLPQPTSVSALVQRRLAQLSPEALRLARVAALAASAFDAELAAAVLEAHPLDLAEPWRELEAAHVIRDGAFAHDLVFEATRESVPAPIAQLLHRRIAEHLVARGAADAAVAPHWAGALEWPRCGEAYTRAARRARSASQRAHEIECWQRAADAFERAGLAERAFEARCESVPACIVVQGVEAAQRVIDPLLAAARGDAQRAAALIARANAALMAADHEAGIAAAGEAARLARRLDSPWPAFEAARLLAVGLAIAGRGHEALATIEPLRDLVEREGDAEQRGHFWSDYAYVLNGVRRLRDTAHALQQAIVNAQALGDLAELATLTSNLATVRGNLGHVPEALELAERALALQADLGALDGPPGAVVETYVGLYLGMSGRYSEALERLDAALARFARDRQALWVAVASNHKAQLLCQLGQFARARQALEYAEPPVESVRARGALVAARIEHGLGYSGHAAIQRAVETLAPGSDPNVRMLVMLDAALARFARDKQLLWVAVASNHKAQLLCQLGQFARAGQVLDYAEPPVESVRARGALMAARIERGLGHSGHAAIQRAVETLAPGSDPNVRMLVMLDAAPADDHQLALERVDEVLAMAERMEFGGVAMAARLRRAQLQCRAGEVQAAAAAMRDLVERLDAVQPSDLTLGEAWWAAAQVFDAAGDGDEALMALARGAQWLRRVALPQVPEAFRDSFLQRNPSHRALLAAADRRIAQ